MVKKIVTEDDYTVQADTNTALKANEANSMSFALANQLKSMGYTPQQIVGVNQMLLGGLGQLGTVYGSPAEATAAAQAKLATYDKTALTGLANQGAQVVQANIDSGRSSPADMFFGIPTEIVNGLIAAEIGYAAGPILGGGEAVTAGDAAGAQLGASGAAEMATPGLATPGISQTIAQTAAQAAAPATVDSILNPIAQSAYVDPVSLTNTLAPTATSQTGLQTLTQSIGNTVVPDAAKQALVDQFGQQTANTIVNTVGKSVVSTMANGGDVQKGIQSALLSTVGGQIANSGPVRDIAKTASTMVDTPAVQQAIQGAITGAVGSGSVAALTGQNVLKAAGTGAAGGAVGNVVGNQVNNVGAGQLANIATQSAVTGTKPNVGSVLSALEAGTGPNSQVVKSNLADQPSNEFMDVGTTSGPVGGDIPAGSTAADTYTGALDAPGGATAAEIQAADAAGGLPTPVDNTATLPTLNTGTSTDVVIPPMTMESAATTAEPPAAVSTPVTPPPDLVSSIPAATPITMGSATADAPAATPITMDNYSADSPAPGGYVLASTDVPPVVDATSVAGTVDTGTATLPPGAAQDTINQVDTTTPPPGATAATINDVPNVNSPTYIPTGMGEVYVTGDPPAVGPALPPDATISGGVPADGFVAPADPNPTYVQGTDPLPGPVLPPDATISGGVPDPLPMGEAYVTGSPPGTGPTLPPDAVLNPPDAVPPVITPVVGEPPLPGPALPPDATISPLPGGGQTTLPITAEPVVPTTPAPGTPPPAATQPPAATVPNVTQPPAATTTPPAATTTPAPAANPGVVGTDTTTGAPLPTTTPMSTAVTPPHAAVDATGNVTSPTVGTPAPTNPAQAAATTPADQSGTVVANSPVVGTVTAATTTPAATVLNAVQPAGGNTNVATNPIVPYDYNPAPNPLISVTTGAMIGDTTGAGTTLNNTNPYTTPADTGAGNTVINGGTATPGTGGGVTQGDTISTPVNTTVTDTVTGGTGTGTTNTTNTGTINQPGGTDSTSTGGMTDAQLLSLLGQIYSSDNTSKAINDAMNALQASGTAAMGTIKGYTDPYFNAGTGALGQITAGQAPGGQFNTNFTMADAQNTPAMQFAQQQGMDVIQNSAAGKGGLLGSNTLQGLEKFGQANAAQYENQAYNQWLATRQANLAGLQNTAAGGNLAGQNASNAISDIQTGLGNSQAETIKAQSQNQSDMVNKILTTYKATQSPSQISAKTNVPESTILQILQKYLPGYNSGNVTVTGTTPVGTTPGVNNATGTTTINDPSTGTTSDLTATPLPMDTYNPYNSSIYGGA